MWYTRTRFALALGCQVAMVGAPAAEAAGRRGARAGRDVADARDDATLARAQFEAGARLFEVGRFAEAADAFEQAYRAKPDTSFLFNLAQCRRKLGQYDEALRLYRTYVKRESDPVRRRDVERIIERVEVERDEQRRESPSVAMSALGARPLETPTHAALVAAPPSSQASWARSPWVWGAAGAVIAGAVVTAILLSRDEGVLRFCGECDEGPFGVPAR